MRDHLRLVLMTAIVFLAYSFGTTAIGTTPQKSELQKLIDACPEGGTLIIKKGNYYLSSPLLIAKSIDIDFNGSTVTTPNVCVLMTTVEIKMSKGKIPTQVDIKKHLKHIGIKNLTVNCVKASGQTGYQRCVEFHYVDDVVLSGITINNWSVGRIPEEHEAYNTAHYTYRWANDVGFKSYEPFMIAIRYYVTADINHCEFNNFGTEGITLLPSKNPNNYAKLTYNKGTSTYHSMIQVCDGRCYVAYNDCSGFDGSAFNLFCYDSEICYNKFSDGNRSAAIDLCENGQYKPYNVYIHDNECTDTYDLVWICGKSIRVVDNMISSSKAKYGVRFFSGLKSDWECNNTPHDQNDLTISDIVINGNQFINLCGNDIYSEATELKNISITNNSFTKAYDAESNQKAYFYFKQGVNNLTICGNIFSTLQRSRLSSGFLGFGEVFGTVDHPSLGTLVVANNTIKNLDQLKNKGLKGEQMFLLGGYRCDFDTVIIKDNMIPAVKGVAQPFVNPSGLANDIKLLSGEVVIETDLDLYSGWKARLKSFGKNLKH